MNSKRVPATISDVPNHPAEGRQHRSVSFYDPEWEVGKILADAMGTTRNAVIEELFSYWLHEREDPPERPPVEAVRAAYARWSELQGRIYPMARSLPCAHVPCGAVSGPCLTPKGRVSGTLHEERIAAAVAALEREDLG